MAPTKATETPERSRLILDLAPDVRRRARLLAARDDLTLQEYVRRALDRQLEADEAAALSASDDPLLAALWDNDADDTYDQLQAR